MSLSDRLPVGCGDHCENRLTLTECLASVCPLGDRCGNQRLQKRLYPRLELFKTSSRGFGLRALEDIPKDALVQEYIGEVMGADEFLERTKNYGQNTPVYFFNLDADLVIDASDKGSMARFINHSCGPNCRTEKWAVGGETRIGIMADQMIPKGTEVTYNYQFESFGETRHVCLCGANNCSGFLGVRPKNEKDAADAKKKKKKKGGHAGAAPAAPLADVGPARDPRLLRWVRGSDEGGALCEGMLLKTEGEYGLVAGAAGAAAEAFGEWLPLAGLNLAELPDEGRHVARGVPRGRRGVDPGGGDAGAGLGREQDAARAARDGRQDRGAARGSHGAGAADPAARRRAAGGGAGQAVRGSGRTSLAAGAGSAGRQRRRRRRGARGAGGLEPRRAGARPRLAPRPPRPSYCSPYRVSYGSLNPPPPTVPPGRRGGDRGGERRGATLRDTR